MWNTHMPKIRTHLCKYTAQNLARRVLSKIGQVVRPAVEPARRSNKVVSHHEK